MMKAIALALVCLISFCVQAQQPNDPQKLIKDENLILVQAHCTPCHSEKLITQNRGDKQEWLELIRWMQKTQGLWEIPADVESKIVTYLAKNYPPNPNRRRKPLAPELMPQLPKQKPPTPE